jgi:uncharacterized membrane protein YoaK (UPF0700 family)
MHRYARSHIALAIGASALAGYVDAIGFLSLEGFFVSFMSGNTTRLAVGVAGIPAEALVAGRLILAFLGGVILGSLIGRLGGWKRQPMILMLVALMIALGALAGMWGAPSIATLLVAAAMGAENTTFERDGEVSIGLTYMTGTLVKLGQRIARALTGGAEDGLASLCDAVAGAGRWRDHRRDAVAAYRVGRAVAGGGVGGGAGGRCAGHRAPRQPSATKFERIGDGASPRGCALRRGAVFRALERAVVTPRRRQAIDDDGRIRVIELRRNGPGNLGRLHFKLSKRGDQGKRLPVELWPAVIGHAEAVNCLARAIGGDADLVAVARYPSVPADRLLVRIVRSDEVPVHVAGDADRDCVPAIPPVAKA